MSEAKISEAALILDRYDTGLLGDGGGGDVNWWWDYIRSELDRAHDFYQDQADHLYPQPAERVEQQIQLVNADEAPFGLTTAEKVAWARGANDAIKEYALAATGKQQVGEEMSVEEDVYCSIADMIEPYVQREGTNPDGPLPASVHDSVQIIFDHWLKTRAQVGEVQGDALTALADKWDRAKQVPRYVDEDGVHSCAEQLRAAIAARQLGVQETPPTVREEAVKFFTANPGLAEYYLRKHLGMGRCEAPPPAFYLDAGTWMQVRVPMTKHRDVRVLRHGFDHGDTELVPFYTAPPAQGIDLGQLQRYDLDEGFDHYRGLPKDKGAHLYEDATGDWVKWDDVQTLIGQHDAAPGVGNG